MALRDTGRRLALTVLGVGAALATQAPTAMSALGAPVVVLHRSPDRNVFAPAVSGSLVAWLSARGEPKECSTLASAFGPRAEVRRVEVLTPAGGTRILHATDADHPRLCVFRPVAANGALFWAETGSSTRITWTFRWVLGASCPGFGCPPRYSTETGTYFIGPSYDKRGSDIVVGRDREDRSAAVSMLYEIEGLHGGFRVYGIVPSAQSVALNLWPRFLNSDGLAVIFVLPDGKQISGLSVPLPLPPGFDGLDAGDGQIAVRIHDPDGYRLIEIDPATGEQRTLLSGVEHLSLPAVAAGNAAVLRRDGEREQLLLVPLSGDGSARILASRVGAPRWGAGEIAEGRPVAYDGKRIVFTARHAVLAVTPPTP